MTLTAEVVGPVEPGQFVVLRGPMKAFDEDFMTTFRAEIIRANGHEDFTILFLEPGVALSVDTCDDLIEQLRSEGE